MREADLGERGFGCLVREGELSGYVHGSFSLTTVDPALCSNV
jgi:hypothetical protein